MSATSTAGFINYMGMLSCLVVRGFNPIVRLKQEKPLSFPQILIILHVFSSGACASMGVYTSVAGADPGWAGYNKG